MTSVVSEFLIGPALRSVRRFSRSAATSESVSASLASDDKSDEKLSGHDDAISETEEESYVKDGEDTASPAPSSRSSMATSHDRDRDLALDHENENNIIQLGEQRCTNDINGEYGSGSTRSLLVSRADSIYGDQRENDHNDQRDRRQEGDMGNTPDVVREENRIVTGTPRLGAGLSPAEPTPITNRPSEPLPEDDGMSILRKRILHVQARGLPAPEKARLMHDLLMENYIKSKHSVIHQESEQVGYMITSSIPVERNRDQRPSLGRLETFNRFWQSPLGEVIGEIFAPEETFNLSEKDKAPTFAPLEPGEEDSEYRPLGCEHYKRNVKLQCSICSQWYTCRFCHDQIENHSLIRKETKNMLCMFCGTAQRAGEVCVSCGEIAAMYYCSICKLWNNDPDKNMYHCNDCGICRIGRGIGKDFFHCKKCNACLAISIENDHKCVERMLDCDCPICGDYLFSSPRPVCFMKCGHAIHRNCYDQHILTAYKCPVCTKSIMNMETQFRKMDIAIQNQPMPGKFRDTRAFVLCNDCSARTTVSYHWLGLKCAVCHSYNTSEIQILGNSAEVLAAAAPAQPSTINMPLSAANWSPAEATPGPAAPRDIPSRRRHSSTLHANVDDQAERIGSFLIQDRLARSHSPPRHLSQLTMDSVAERGIPEENNAEEEEEDMFGLWNLVPRSPLSPTHKSTAAFDSDVDEEDESEDESISSQGGPVDEDDDEDDDDIFSLPFHR